MKLYECILTRCHKCRSLYIKSEQHECKSFQYIAYDKWAEEIAITLQQNGKLKATEICRILNKKVGRLQFDQFRIGYKMEHLPKIFTKDQDGYWNLLTEDVLT